MIKENIIKSGLLPSVSKVNDAESIKAFSQFCETTCSNLFAFSLNDLKLESEEFLQFQYLADELKEASGEIEEQIAISNKAYAIYEKMLINCWDAFNSKNSGSVDAGKFIALQLIAVNEFERSIGN